MPTSADVQVTGYPWFAVQVRTRYEASVGDFLRGKGYEPFVPLYERRKRWSDRIKVTSTALFPGYIFCRINLQQRLPVLTTPGVIQIVGHSRRPVPVDEAEIQGIQSILASGLPSEPWPYIGIGDRVLIEHGPLRGLEGTLVEVRGAHRLVLSVTLLQRSVAAEIDPASVKLLYPVAKKDIGTEGQISSHISQASRPQWRQAV